jgi:hypothetical protein
MTRGAGPTFKPGLLSIPAAPTTAGIASKAAITMQRQAKGPPQSFDAVKIPEFCLMAPNPGKGSRVARPLHPCPKARP